MSRYVHRQKCRVQISDEQMNAIHEKRCTTLIVKNGKRPFFVGDKIEINSPMGLRDDVIVRHVETNSPALQNGFCLLSVIPEDMIPFNAWCVIRELRAENDTLKAQGAAA